MMITPYTAASSDRRSSTSTQWLTRLLATLFCLGVTPAGVSGEVSASGELLRNGDFKQIFPVTGRPLNWLSTPEKATRAVAEGMELKGLFTVDQLVDVSCETSHRFVLNVNMKILHGSMQIFAQAFLPGVQTRETYLELGSTRRSVADEAGAVRMVLSIPDGVAYPFQLKIAFISSDPETEAMISSISLRAVEPGNKPDAGTLIIADDSLRVLSVDFPWFATAIPCSGIYLSASADEYELIAAKTIRKHVYEMCGQFLPIAPLAAGAQLPKLKGAILIGRVAAERGVVSKDEIAELGEGGYQLKCRGGVLSIVGKDGSGQVAGAYGLLKTLGVEFLSSREVEYPSTKPIAIGAMRVSRTPSFAIRSRGGIFNPEFSPELLFGSPRRVGGSGSTLHSMGFLVSFDKYAKEHPEFFALQKDAARLREKPQGNDGYVHLCMSSPEVKRIASKNLLHWIEAEPYAKYFYIGQGDCYEYACQCESCRAMDPEPGDFTRRVMTFINEVTAEAARRYPDKVFLMLLYEGADRCSPGLEPAPQVQLVYCPFRPKWWCHSHAFCSYNTRGLDDLRLWISRFPGRIHVFDYPEGAQELVSIFASFDAIAEKIRLYAGNGVRGLTLCGTPVNFNALFINVMSRLMWDPHTDVNAAVDDFMARYYGAAAPHMRSYFDLIYAQVKERQLHMNCELLNPGLVDEPFARRAYELFDKSEVAVKNQPKLLERVCDEKIFLLFSDLSERNLNSGVKTTDPAVFAAKLAEFAQTAAKLKIHYLSTRYPDPALWFWNVAGLSLGSPWYADPKLAKLSTSPTATLQAEEPTSQERAADGSISLAPQDLKGGERDRKNRYVVARRACFSSSRVVCDFALDATATPPVRIVVRGSEERNCAINVLLNGKTVFKKLSSEPFYLYEGERDWKKTGERRIAIPVGALRPGRNTVEIVNVTPESLLPGGTPATAECGYQTNPYWGWLIVERVSLTK